GLLASAAVLTSMSAVAAAEDVNIYTTREPGLIQPLLDAFTASSGVKVNTVFLKDGLIEQNAERQYFEIKEPYIHKDDKTDAELTIEPCNHFEAHLLIDFNSSVVGVQEYSFNYDLNYAKEIAPCRTFCFFSQLEQLSAAGLIKGGDMEKSLVIVDNDPSEDQIKRIASLFNAGNIEVKKGYLSNVELHYDNECARHKMLDLIGDFALVGLPLKAKITAKKTGHRINTNVAKILLQNK
ncbi:MAG: hypothetical protein GX664_02150, partial [Bacteroidales bacterium]|nr:hypothetical protein [Bacteroidales bacterium]